MAQEICGFTATSFPGLFPRKKNGCVTAFWASPRFEHPHYHIPSVLGISFSYYCSVLGISGTLPEGFTKQGKTTLTKFAKKFEYDLKLESLFYVAKEKDGTALRRNRLVIAEEDKARVFEECHSAPFSGHAGRDNTLWKIKERFYWPDYYKDKIEMVSYKFYLFADDLRPL